MPIELFQILKNNAVKVLHSVRWQIWKTQQWPQDWKNQFSFQSQRKAMTKNVQTTIIVLISHTSKVKLKTLQARLQQYMNQERPDVQAGFRKGRGTRDQIINIYSIIEKAREFQKNIYMSKPLIMWVTTNCEKFSKGWEYQTTLPAS